MKLYQEEKHPAMLNGNSSDENANKWTELDTKTDGNKLSGKSDNGGIFAVLTPKK